MLGLMAREPAGHTLQEFIDELATVVHDAGEARELAIRAGFPVPDLPEFDTARVFWSRVVRASHIGMTLGGVAAIVAEAKAKFPGNQVFASYVASASRDHGRGRLSLGCLAPILLIPTTLLWAFVLKIGVLAIVIAIVGTLSAVVVINALKEQGQRVGARPLLNITIILGTATAVATAADTLSTHDSTDGSLVQSPSDSDDSPPSRAHDVPTAGNEGRREVGITKSPTPEQSERRLRLGEPRTTGKVLIGTDDRSATVTIHRSREDGEPELLETLRMADCTGTPEGLFACERELPLGQYVAEFGRVKRALPAGRSDGTRRFEVGRQGAPQVIMANYHVHSNCCGIISYNIDQGDARIFDVPSGGKEVFMTSRRVGNVQYFDDIPMNSSQVIELADVPGYADPRSRGWSCSSAIWAHEARRDEEGVLHLTKKERLCMEFDIVYAPLGAPPP